MEESRRSAETDRSSISAVDRKIDRHARVLPPLLLAFFMRALPLTMFGPLLPGIARSLGAGLAEIGWIVATYATGSLIAQPVMGRLSDIRGRRAVFLWCIALFSAGSLVCALSTSLSVLVTGRVIQALGAGGIAPVATAIVGDKIDERSRGAALGALYGIFGVGTMAGALLGGLLVDGGAWLAAHVALWAPLESELSSYAWHLVFWVNVALCAGTYFAALGLPADRLSSSGVTHSFDVRGIFYIAAFTTCIMGAATNSGLIGLEWLGVGGMTLFAFAVWERRAPEPLIDPGLFVGRGPALIYSIAFLCGIPSFTLTIYSATYFITRFHTSELQSGMALFVLASFYVAGAIIGGRIMRIADARAVLATGLSMAGAGLLMLAAASNEALVVTSMALGGLGLGLISAPPNALIFRYFDSTRTGAATGLATMLATSGSVTAPAVISAYLHYGTKGAAAEMRADFVLGAGLSALCVLLSAALPRGTDAERTNTLA